MNKYGYCLITVLCSSLLFSCGGSSPDDAGVEVTPEIPIGPLDAPQELEITKEVIEDGTYTVTLDWAEVADVIDYVVHYREESEIDYQTITVDSPPVEIKDLTVSVYYAFVEANGGATRVNSQSEVKRFSVGNELKTEGPTPENFTNRIELMDLKALPDGKFIALYSYPEMTWDNPARAPHLPIIEKLDETGGTLWAQKFLAYLPYGTDGMNLRALSMTEQNEIIAVGSFYQHIDGAEVLEQAMLILDDQGSIKKNGAVFNPQDGTSGPSEAFGAVANYNNAIFVAANGTITPPYYTGEQESANPLHIWQFSEASVESEAERLVNPSSWFTFDLISKSGNLKTDVRSLKIIDDGQAYVTVNFNSSDDTSASCGFSDREGDFQYNSCNHIVAYDISPPNVINAKVEIYRENEPFDAADLDNKALLSLNENVVETSNGQLLRVDYDYAAESAALIESYESNQGEVDLKVIAGQRFGFYYLDNCNSSLQCERHYLDYSKLSADYVYRPELILVSQQTGVYHIMLEAHIASTEQELSETGNYFRQVDYILAEISPEGVLTPLTNN